METPDTQQGYDHEAEERAYAEEAGDQDVGPASTPEEGQPDQAEGD